MKRHPLSRILPVRLAVLIAPLLAAWPQNSPAADQEWSGGTGGAWYTLTNWTSGTGFPGEVTATVAGEGTPADIMTAAAANAATNIGINMNTGGGQLSLGAIDFNKTNTSACTIGNSSTTASGVLLLNGATVNGVANTLIRCNNEASLTISNVNSGTAAVTMGLSLGSANGVFFAGQNGAATPVLRTLTINSIISEATAGNGFTKSGPGVLTLTAANNISGPITVNDGSLRLQNAAAAGTSHILLTNSDGVALNNNDVLITGGLTYANNITLENTGDQDARTRLQSTSTVNASANIWTGNIIFKGPSSFQTIVADSAPLLIDGNFLQDGTLPSPSILIRGGNAAAPGTMNGNIFLGTGTLFKTDGGTWTINSTGNTMGTVICADGLLILNNNDALEADSAVQMGQGSGTTGRMQINAGFTQQLTAINTIAGSTSATGHTILGPGAIDFGGVSRTITVVDNTATGTELNINAPVIGTGGFTKAGTGNLIINGTVAGPVAVDPGGLSGLGGTGSLNGGVTVNAGGILGAGGPLTAGTLTSAGVTLAAGSNLALNLGSSGYDFIANTGALTSAGATINVIPNGSFTAGQIVPVVGYTGASPGTLPFTIGVLLPLGSRATAAVTDTGTAIGIQILTADKVVWTGATNAVWDIGTTANWKLQSNSSATTFQQYDALLFDDTGTNTTITIGAGVEANAVRAEFTNTTANPYTITGAGGMGAPGSSMVLDKTGNGVVTLNTTNVYTGATNVAAGTLTGNYNPGAAVTPIPATSPVNIATGATLRVIANDSAYTVAAPLSGPGTVAFNAHAIAGSATAHQVTFSGNNTGFTGNIVMEAPLTGTYRFTNVTPASLGSATIDVQSGAQVLAAPTSVFPNPITIAGIGWADANGFLGSLRIDNTTWAGPVTVSGTGARICAHNSTGTVSGDISGGPLEVNVSNYNNSYTVRFTGNNSYSTTTIGGGNTQTGGVPSMRLNIGVNGTTGTLGTGNVTINGDGANGVLGFDRSDGYTLLPGQTLTGSGSNILRTFIDLDCQGAGFNDNGNAITLGTASNLTGGQVRAGQGRANAVTTFTGSLTCGRLGNAVVNNSTININSGAVLNVGYFTTAEAAGNGGTVNQAAGTTVNVTEQLRVGHFSTNTSTYNMNGGALTLTGASSTLTPSTSGAGNTTTTGDNNINITNPTTIVGGGIYLGIDGTGIFNHNSGTVTTNWIVLDNRGNTGPGANMPDGIDRYNISGTALLKLRSEWGLIARNATTDVSLGGGTIQIDNSGTGGPAGNTGPDLDVPLDAVLNIVGATTQTTLDTNGAGNSFILTKDVTGIGELHLTGGGRINFRTTATQNVSAFLSGSTAILKSDAGTTVLTGSSSTYAGTATVNAGTLRVDGTLSGSVVVQTGATLAGSGTAGAVTAQSGGIVAPGASVGTLAAASLDLQTGSRCDVEISAAATADKLNVTGALTANGTIKVTLSGYVPVANDSFDIADAGSIAGTPVFDFSAAVLTAGLAWDTAQFSTNGTISVVSSDPFTTWAASFGLTGGKTGDDDKDGGSNLLEFATNSNPVAGGSSARSFPRLHPLGGDIVLTLTAAVRKSAVFAASGATQTATKDMVIYTVDASDDLANWTTVVVTELNPADSAAVQAALSLPALDAEWEWHSFRTDGGTTLDSRDMIRLSVAAQP